MGVEQSSTIYERYSGQSDNELLSAIHNDDKAALDYLMIRYKNLARKRAKTMYLLGGDYEDMLQEAMIGLYKAICDYKDNRNASFITFADICIQRQIYTAVKKANTQKNQPLNNYISFDMMYGENGFEIDKNMKLDKIAGISYSSDPEEYVIGRETANTLEERLYEHLSAFERRILNLYLRDMNSEYIAKQVGRDQKSVHNALTRIKHKLRLVCGEYQ